MSDIDDRIEGEVNWRDMKCRACGLPGGTTERLRELITWAESRIEWCRREEQKFGAGSVAIEAAQERRTLKAVLKILDGEQ